MARTQMPGLGGAEAEILKIVWELQEATVQQIYERLPRGREISPATVQTVLRRLHDKGYLKRRLSGKAHVFWPAIQPDKVITNKVMEVVNRFFGGKAVPLIVHLARSRKLKPEDLDQAKRQLKEGAGESRPAAKAAAKAPKRKSTARKRARR